MKPIHLRVARKQARLTQEQLAAKAGMLQEEISALELVIRNPGFARGLAVADALGVDPHLLRFGPDEAA